MFRPALSNLRGCVARVTALAGLLAVSAPAFGIDVAFEKIARSGDPVPGRETLNVVFNGRAFQAGQQPGVLSRPAINEAGDVVFRARSSHPSNFNQDPAIGLYVKRAGQPLARLVDQSLTAGLPTFPVPGRPAGTVFGDFDPPLLNNNGDVIFRATYTGGAQPGGQGWFSTTVAGGAIVNVVNTSTVVPGFPAAVFDRGFNFSFSLPVYSGALNDAGQIVFHGRFQRPGAPFEDSGLYGTTVAGGALARLADTTGMVAPIGNTQTFRQLSQQLPPALSDSGQVIFQGSIGPTSTALTAGIFTVPVDGSAAATARALQFQSVPLSSGDGAFAQFFGPGDVTESGLFAFAHAFGNTITSVHGVFSGPLAGGAISSSIDGAIAGSVPGRPGANWRSMRLGALSESGQFGFFAGDSTSQPGLGDGQGLYYDSTQAGTPAALIANNGMTPPGLAAPNVMNAFSFRSPAINDSGNVVFANEGFNGVNDAIFGLYFYESCSQTLNRIVDRTVSAAPLPTGIGGTFAGVGCAGAPCERGIFIYDDLDARSGRFRAVNSNNDVAFLSAFSTFDVGIYVAHVDAAGGELTITAPADVTLECPADTSPAAAGAAGAAGCGAIAVTFADTPTGVCGGAQVIQRTWTANNGGTPATDVQLITLTDTTAPTLACPANTTVACSANNAAERAAWIASATATDACGAATITTATVSPSGACGTTEVTFTATDACDNDTTCIATFTVVDTTPPTITAPANLTLECDGTDHSAAIQAWLGSGTTSDSCGAVQVTNNYVAASSGCNSSTTVTWTGADPCGNTASASATLLIDDNTPPMIAAPVAVAVGVDAGLCTASNVALGNASAVDSCGAVTVTNNAPAAFGLGTTLVVWTATDACGNSANATQAVTVINLEPIAEILVEQITNIGVAASVRFDAIASSDPEDATTALMFRWTLDGVITCNGTAASCREIVRTLSYGDHTITLLVTDTCGNTSEVTQTLVVNPAELSVFELSRVVVNFCHNPPRLRINGQIGLPIGVAYTELSPQARLAADVAGVPVLPLTNVAFTEQGPSGRHWRYSSTAPLGVRRFNINWSGNSYLFREAGFPVELRSDSITTTETQLEVRVRHPNDITAPFTLAIGSAYISFNTDMTVAASNVAYDVEVPRKRFMLTLPFPLLASSDLVFSGFLARTLDAGDGLTPALGRYQATVFFDAALLPQGALSTPVVVGADVHVGTEGYPGGNEIGTSLIVDTCTWQTPDGGGDEE